MLAHQKGLAISADIANGKSIMMGSREDNLYHSEDQEDGLRGSTNLTAYRSSKDFPSIGHVVHLAFVSLTMLTDRG